MEKLELFSVPNFLLKAQETQKRVMVELSTDRIILGTVQFIDLQGPFPGFQVHRGSHDQPVVCFLSQTVSLQWDDGDLTSGVV